MHVPHRGTNVFVVHQLLEHFDLATEADKVGGKRFALDVVVNMGLNTQPFRNAL